MKTMRLTALITFYILAAAATAIAGGYSATSAIDMFVGETRVLRYEAVDQLAIGDPTVADVQMFAEKAGEVILNAKAPGVTTLFVWDGASIFPHRRDVVVSNKTVVLDKRIFNFKHYTLTRTEYDNRLSRITVSPDESNVTNLKSVLTPLIGENSYSIDINRNRVIMRGTKQDLDSATAILGEIDQPLRQILIEAKVIEITKDDLNRLGTMLAGSDGDMSLKGDLSGDTPLFNLAFDTFTDLARRFSITIDTLRTAGVGRTLVNPKIATLDGKTAWILAGEKYPVATRDNDKGLVSFDYVHTGISLAVTPRVGRDDTITLWLKPEVSNISGWVGDPSSSSDNAAPIIDTREVLSEVRLKDGESIIIGGLQKEESIMTKSKVPILGDIPLIGKAFRKKRTSEETSELVIVITPHIMDENEKPDLGRFGLLDMSKPNEAASEAD